MLLRGTFWSLLLLASAFGARAAPPNAIHYQGFAVDGAGTPLNGNVGLVLRVWSDAASTSPAFLVYEESHPSIAVADGVFSAELGGGTPLVGSFGEATFSGASRWLEVTVNGETMSPRQRVLSSAYALQSRHADDATTLGGVGVGTLQSRVTGTCAAGSSIRAIDANGSVVCEPDDDTGDISAVSAGSGLTGGGTAGDVTLAIDGAIVQSRISAACPAGQSIRAVNGDGSVACELDDDSGGDVTGVTAGVGLFGGGASGPLDLAVAFGGSGAANFASRSDHLHLGQSWTTQSEPIAFAVINNNLSVPGFRDGIFGQSNRNAGARGVVGYAPGVSGDNY